jgi:protease-4
VGGYIAAKFSNKYKTLNAGIVGTLSVFFSLLIVMFSSNSNVPLWFHIMGIVLSIPCAILGYYAWQKYSVKNNSALTTDTTHVVNPAATPSKSNTSNWLIIIIIFFIIFFVFSIFIAVLPNSANKLTDNQNILGCNVALIDIKGSLVTTYTPYDTLISQGSIWPEVESDFIVSKIQAAAEDANIKAIVLNIDSPGGNAVAGEEIMNALLGADKPTVAHIRSIGTSAAYWAATGADQIFASKNSEIGSIGVTMSYLEEVKKNEKDGRVYRQITAGKYKDIGSPAKILTDEDRNILQQIIDQIQLNFIQAVAYNRKLDVTFVTRLADGASMLGEKALELQLIDSIGSLEDVKSYLKNFIGEDVEYCIESNPE